MADPKSVTLRYFTKISDDGNSSTWQCQGKVGEDVCKKKIIRQKGAGYTNTFNHVKSHHPEWNEDWSQKKLGFVNAVSIAPVENIYGWVHWITEGLKPFSFVTEATTRTYTKLKPICTNTLLKHMHGIAKQVEEKISLLLAEKKFAILIDGWSKGSTHYVAIFASYADTNSNGYSTVLLAFSPLCDETSMDANEHIVFIKWVLEDLYKLNMENLIGIKLTFYEIQTYFS